MFVHLSILSLSDLERPLLFVCFKVHFTLVAVLIVASVGNNIADSVLFPGNLVYILGVVLIRAGTSHIDLLRL